MPTLLRFGRWRKRLDLLSIITAVGLLFLVAADAQERESAPLDLPKGPAKPGFDITRFSNAGNGWFETFYVTKTEPLGDALKAGKVAEDTRLLVTETKAGKLALLMDQMAYHHIAQGHAGALYRQALERDAYRKALASTSHAVNNAFARRIARQRG